MLAPGDLKVIAFYLPQFHPVPENDQWWGKGFTEWTNVKRARPLFKGHYQPHAPADLGYYDLRQPEVRRRQVELARRYGVHGFCYHHYWFGGRRLLERPLNDFLADRDLDFPFCVCWANESWTRRWDGREQEVLLAQKHTPESDARFIDHLLPVLDDPRYIRVNGAPLLLVYRPGLMPEPARTAEAWRRTARRHGLSELHLCCVESFGQQRTPPETVGFDSAVEFPPHGLRPRDIGSTLEWQSGPQRGQVYDYREVVRQTLTRPDPPYRLFRTAFPSWDNTARRGRDGLAFAHASPDEFELWLTGLVEWTRHHHPEGERLLFVNAWNEWAEGAHLEPDLQFGHQYLEAVRRVAAAPSWEEALPAPASLGHNREELVRQFGVALQRHERSLAGVRTAAAVAESEPWTVDPEEAESTRHEQVDEEVQSAVLADCAAEWRRLSETADPAAAEADGWRMLRAAHAAGPDFLFALLSVALTTAARGSRTACACGGDELLRRCDEMAEELRRLRGELRFWQRLRNFLLPPGGLLHRLIHALNRLRKRVA
jgi:hypothetical protein